MIYDNILDITTVDLSTIFFSKFVRLVQRNNVNNLIIFRLIRVIFFSLITILSLKIIFLIKWNTRVV